MDHDVAPTDVSRRVSALLFAHHVVIDDQVIVVPVPDLDAKAVRICTGRQILVNGTDQEPVVSHSVDSTHALVHGFGSGDDQPVVAAAVEVEVTGLDLAARQRFGHFAHLVQQPARRERLRQICLRAAACRIVPFGQQQDGSNAGQLVADRFTDPVGPRHERGDVYNEQVGPRPSGAARRLPLDMSNHHGIALPLQAGDQEVGSRQILFDEQNTQGHDFIPAVCAARYTKKSRTAMAPPRNSASTPALMNRLLEMGILSVQFLPIHFGDQW